jgi:preprotein translocase subunit YajC
MIKILQVAAQQDTKNGSHLWYVLKVLFAGGAMFFESLAFAIGAPQGGGSGGSAEMFAQFIPLVLMIAVFWFLLIRPQKKRQQEHKGMLEALRRGDTVVTTGGIIGRIVDIDGDILTLDLGETKVRVGRAFISGLFDAKLPQAVKEKKGKSDSREDKASKNAEKPEVDSEASEERKEGKE